MPTIYLDENDQDRPGSVTQVLRRVGQDDLSGDRLFQAVIDNLTRKARVILSEFPRQQNRVAPEDLVNEFITRLLLKLAPADIRNRGHFYALACRNFHWILLDLAKKRRVEPYVQEDAPGVGTGPGVHAEQRDTYEAVVKYMEDAFPEEDRLIFDCRVSLDMTYEQIADELNIPRSSVSARYQRMRAKLAEHFGE